MALWTSDDAFSYWVWPEIRVYWDDELLWPAYPINPFKQAYDTTWSNYTFTLTPTTTTDVTYVTQTWVPVLTGPNDPPF
jgi:hypothetical protein